MERVSENTAALPMLIGFVVAMLMYIPAAEYQDVTVYGVRLFWLFLLLIFGLLLGGSTISLALATKVR